MADVDIVADAGKAVLTTLGLGGNLGDPRQTMAHALHMIDEHPACRVVAVSRIYSTPPWGVTDQPVFLNCCAMVETSLAPEQMMQFCLDTERRLKRVRKVRWGPRLVDIDILTYDDRTIETDILTAPHPRMTERGFVLVPLAEIASDLVVNGKRVEDWAASADKAGIEPVSTDGKWWKTSVI